MCTEALMARGIFFDMLGILLCSLIPPFCNTSLRSVCWELSMRQKVLWKMSIQHPAKCKLYSIIRYLVWKRKIPVEVYEVKTAYGDKGMNHTSVWKWCSECKNGCTSVHDDQRSESPSIVTDEIEGKKKNRKYASWWLQIDCGWTFCDVSANIQIPATQNHHRNPRISETVHKVGPKTADRPKLNQVQAGQEFLRHYKLHGDGFTISLPPWSCTWVEKSFQPMSRWRWRSGRRGWQKTTFRKA